MQKKSIVEVLIAHTPTLMNIQGVIGTALGEHEDKPCIIVFVDMKKEDAAGKIPSQIEGYSVQIKETGNIEARDREN